MDRQAYFPLAVTKDGFVLNVAVLVLGDVNHFMVQCENVYVEIGVDDNQAPQSTVIDYMGDVCVAHAFCLVQSDTFSCTVQVAV